MQTTKLIKYSTFPLLYFSPLSILYLIVVFVSDCRQCTKPNEVMKPYVLIVTNSRKDQGIHSSKCVRP